MKFLCDICPAKVECSHYHEWIAHLSSELHQAEVKRRYCPRFKWPDQGNSYVLTGIPNGLPCRRAELVEWLSTFGVVAEFLHNYKYNFCVFTLQGSSGTSSGEPGIGGARPPVVFNNKFRGVDIFIKPKSEFGPLEWDLLYDSVSTSKADEYNDTYEISKDHISSEKSRDRKKDKVNKSPGRNPRRESSPPGIPRPKKTLVYTNRNLSSNKCDTTNNANQDTRLEPSISTSSSGVSESNSGLPVETVKSSHFKTKSTAKCKSAEACASDDIPLVDKANVGSNSITVGENTRKKKSRQRKKKSKSSQGGNETDESTASGSQVNVPGCNSSNTPANDKSVKTEQQLQPNSTVIEQGQTIQSLKVVEPESLNFRGGFTHSRRTQEERNISESSVTNTPPATTFQVTEIKADSTTPVASKKTSKSSKTMFSQASSQQQNKRNSSQEKPVYQVLQRPGKESLPRNETSKGGGGGLVSQQISGAVPNTRSLENNEASRSTREAPYPRRPVLSPIFTSQLPEVIKAKDLLITPSRSSRNPYRFTENNAPLPYFFSMFQELVKDPHKKPQKSGLMKNFSMLHLNAQLQAFLEAQTLSMDETRLRWQVVLDIFLLLRQQYPHCEVYAFGSIITGLGDFYSDIDIYVDLLGESASGASGKLSSLEALDEVKWIIKKASCPHTKRRFIRNLIPVKSARVPILKLTHDSTTVSCDLSFENRLSVQNTKMMSLYMHLDPKVYPLMVLVRYWGKFHSITGSNYIKNYALTLLVLVFLVKKEIVPSVQFLQTLKAMERRTRNQRSNPDEIDGWDASFCENLNEIYSAFKGQSASSHPSDNSVHAIMKLANEFFEMYANIDFSAVVICPLLGAIMPKEQFLPGNEEALPESLERYKDWAVQQDINRRLNINTYFCVQDPFMLSYNVGGVTPLGTLLKFQIACAKTAQIIKNMDNSPSLLKIFNPLPKHFGEKKFMRVFKTENKSNELRKELMEVLGHSEITTCNAAQEAASRKSSSATLPQHLQSLEKFLDEKYLKAAQKAPKWETFVEIPLDNLFESIFVDKLLKCNVKLSKADMMDKLCAVWKEFASDFLNQIFIGLKLNVDRKDVSRDTVYQGQPLALFNNKTEGKRKWQLKLPFDSQKQTVQVDEQVNNLCKIIMELRSTPALIYYSRFHIKVQFSFWEKRSLSLVQQVIKDMTLVSGRGESQPGKKSKKKLAAENESPYHNKIWVNPVEAEQKICEILEESASVTEASSNVLPLSFNILVKLDLSSLDDRPYIVFVFEKDPVCKSTYDVYSRALRSLSNILIDSFPAYQLYRLTKWLNLTDDEVNQITSRNAGPGEDENEMNGQQSNEGVLLTESEKKSGGRTKLEEDLLIPSSSSTSTCSTTPDVDEVKDEEKSIE